MYLEIIINTDNDVFYGDNLGPELSKILIKYANAIADVSDHATACDLTYSRIRDSNGNVVGEVHYRQGEKK